MTLSAEAPHLHLEAVGQGPGIVLAHGLGGSARNWRPQVRALRASYRVITYDARGHARSGVPEGADAWSMAQLVGDLTRVIADALPADAERPVVGGLSLGAATALGFARAHPERVRGLVLASYPGSMRAGGLASNALDFADRIERDGLEAAGAHYIWGPRSGFDAAGAALVRQGFLEHAPAAIAGLLRDAIAVQPDPDAEAEGLAALPIPALVVAGAGDASSLAASRRLAERLPDARLVVIEGAGHVVNLAKPRDFDAALVRFLEEVAPAAAPPER